MCVTKSVNGIGVLLHPKKLSFAAFFLVLSLIFPARLHLFLGVSSCTIPNLNSSVTTISWRLQYETAVLVRVNSTSDTCTDTFCVVHYVSGW